MFKKLEPTDNVDSFCCSDEDLNDFLLTEAKDYQRELLAVTYLLLDPGTNAIVAYYSLLCDHVQFDKDSKKARNYINRRVPFSKQRNHYPAMKIGRLAVDVHYAHQGIGQYIMDNIKMFLIRNPRFGCKILTVDAYAAALGFYESCGFRYFTEMDEGDETRLMFYDLKNFLG